MNKLPEPKWDKPPVNNKTINMEDKLSELKEQFCNYYCLNKNGLDYEGIHFDYPCDFCMIKDYITFIRDEYNTHHLAK